MLLANRDCLTTLPPLILHRSLLRLLLHAYSLPHLSQPRVRVEIIPSNAHDPAFALAPFDPFRADDGDVGFDGFFPLAASSLSADEVGGVDADGFCNFGADAVDGTVEAFAQRFREHAGGDGDAAKVCHFVRFDGEFFTAVRPCRCSQDEVEGVFGVDGQS